ncbi:MAG: radical SAM protein [Firmicutes bacterium]|nr:radical SAM protein [Bacillota bacterium]
MSYADAPHVVTWELTRACQLHCRHCRAKAIPRRDPEELLLGDIIPVLDDFAEHFARPPVLVFTGGDPLERPDLEDIIQAAIARGLITALAPSVTPRLTPSVLDRWQALGVRSVSLSLDGADAATHDRFRGVRGTYDRTVKVAQDVVSRGIKLQINTSVSPYTVDQLPALAALVDQLGASSWELFFVIPTGRARLQDTLSSEQIERVLQWLVRFQPPRPMRITTVGAPQWARVRHEANPLDPPRTVAREARGFAFIDHRGEVYPSGYLPVSAGNVRHTPFSTIYRDSPLFRLLRDPSGFDGACGRCQYRDECGGSRARAYAMTQSLVASDPGCLKAVG